MNPTTCIECGASLDGKRGCRGPRKFCDKSCAQSYRNRGRVIRTAIEPAAVTGARWIALTKGMFALIDEADFADVSRWNWCVMKVQHSKTFYAGRGRTPHEIEATGLCCPVLLHRYLLGEPAEDVDHHDRDGLNNRRENLRKVTHQQNMMNSMSRSGSSRFKGVSLVRGQWRASMRSNYKTIHLGQFDIEEEAARAYDEAARRLHGEFARVNFPLDGERSALHD